MDVANTFKDRLFHVFRNSPLFNDLISILSDPIQDLFDVCDYLLTRTAIEDYEGEQLDFVGELFGVTRPHEQEPKLFKLYRFGEACDPDNDHGWVRSDGTGSYIATNDGLSLQSDSDALMSDVAFRFLVKQKGAAFRKRMTPQNYVAYLSAFGCRCLIDDDTKLEVTIDPLDWNAFTDWERSYIMNRGFKPAGVRVTLRPSTRHEATI